MLYYYIIDGGIMNVKGEFANLKAFEEYIARMANNIESGYYYLKYPGGVYLYTKSTQEIKRLPWFIYPYQDTSSLIEQYNKKGINLISPKSSRFSAKPGDRCYINGHPGARGRTDGKNLTTVKAKGRAKEILNRKIQTPRIEKGLNNVKYNPEGIKD
jgi:hypothetical protein